MQKVKIPRPSATIFDRFRKIFLKKVKIFLSEKPREKPRKYGKNHVGCEKSMQKVKIPRPSATIFSITIRKNLKKSEKFFFQKRARNCAIW